MTLNRDENHVKNRIVTIIVSSDASLDMPPPSEFDKNFATLLQYIKYDDPENFSLISCLGTD